MGISFQLRDKKWLAVAINKLIRRNLLMIKDFIEKELYIFQKPEIFLIFIDVLIERSGSYLKLIQKSLYI